MLHLNFHAASCSRRPEIAVIEPLEVNSHPSPPRERGHSAAISECLKHPHVALVVAVVAAAAAAAAQRSQNKPRQIARHWPAFAATAQTILAVQYDSSCPVRLQANVMKVCTNSACLKS